MIKLVISLCILTSSLAIQAQSPTLVEYAFPTVDGQITYQGVVETEANLLAADLYLRAKEWVARSFKSAQDVIQVDDNKVIIVRSYFEKGHNTVVLRPKKWFTLKIEFKDGRFRYRLFDVVYEFEIAHEGIYLHEEQNLSSWLKYSSHKNERKRDRINEGLENYAREIDNEFLVILSSLEQAVAEEIPDDDW